MNQEPGPTQDRPHAEHPIALEFPATIAVIGAGPIGMEAALYGRFLGYDVTLFERGTVADNVRQWQHSRMWTPFQYLHSRLGRMAIETHNPNQVFPPLDQEVTGEQWLRSYLMPLSETDLVAKSLREHHRVLSVHRCHYTKHQNVPAESRWQDGFVVVWEDAAGTEQRDTFDFVLDTSGTFQQQQSWGAGGSPAIGERQLRSARETDPELQASLNVTAPNFAAEPNRWKESRVLVIGDSPHAAETLTQWTRVVGDSGRLIWAIPQSLSETGLYPVAANDLLPARVRLFTAANEAIRKHRRQSLAELVWVDGSRPTQDKIQVVANTNLAAIHWDAAQKQFHVRLQQWCDVDWEAAPDDFEEPDEIERELRFDQVVVALGHQVDEEMTRELIVPRCPRTEASASLVDALLAHHGDRLDFEFTDPTWTWTPEGRFFVLGAKSFGRQPNYFHRLGLQQVRDAYRWIVGRATLDVEQTLRS